MRLSLKGLTLAAVPLLLPIAALAGDIQVNATCVVGTCPPVPGPSDALQFGQSTGPTSGSTTTTVNGDSYGVNWTYRASFDSNGTYMYVTPVVTYLGSLPTISNDIVTFNAYQNYYSAGPDDWSGSYTEHVPLFISSSAGTASGAQGEAFYNGQGVGLLSENTPGFYDLYHTATLSGIVNPTLTEEFEFTFDFTAGTTNGANLSSPAVPEPAAALLVIFAFVALGIYRLYRKPALGV